MPVITHYRRLEFVERVCRLQKEVDTAIVEPTLPNWGEAVNAVIIHNETECRDIVAHHIHPDDSYTQLDKHPSDDEP